MSINDPENVVDVLTQCKIWQPWRKLPSVLQVQTYPRLRRRFLFKTRHAFGKNGYTKKDSALIRATNGRKKWHGQLVSTKEMSRLARPMLSDGLSLMAGSTLPTKSTGTTNWNLW
ncbi:hypothetical protein VC83_02785 [Pseudogymnoascus destructans]|uniref:Uncharacterized protein n=1 Tax=Pseudogymnoascus destructans TaxID=655981 RepID=A0A177AEB4_9PEZI|nr:uncharacterized protein VC83_02785 [Pseudogymnoascus destructans]OAF60150.1 hypothetical protein VC83_02785 [Pseudogymnoascus destructans]